MTKGGVRLETSRQQHGQVLGNHREGRRRLTLVAASLNCMSPVVYRSTVRNTKPTPSTMKNDTIWKLRMMLLLLPVAEAVCAPALEGPLLPAFDGSSPSFDGSSPVAEPTGELTDEEIALPGCLTD